MASGGSGLAGQGQEEPRHQGRGEGRRASPRAAPTGRRPRRASRKGHQQHHLGDDRDPRGDVAVAGDEEQIGAHVEEGREGEGEGDAGLQSDGDQDVLGQAVEEAEGQKPDQDTQGDG